MSGMELPLNLQSLAPAERARVIYSQAQSEVSSRLWQAALGKDADEAKQSAGLFGGSTGTGTSLPSLLGSMGNMGGGHICHCDHGEEFMPVAPARASELPAVTQIAAPEVKTLHGSASVSEVHAGLGPNARYGDVLNAASERTGIPANTLAAIVDAEAAKSPDGSWKLYSRNPRSSAAGLGQFLSGTWLDMAREQGSWLNETARARGWVNESGKIQSGARASILALRYDGEASINAIADYARQNIGVLRRQGVAIPNEPTKLAQAAYLGHHLGPGDAVRFMKGGLDDGRARVLLDAQIGSSRAARRISRAGGSASLAHRQWLNGYIGNNIRPDRYAL